MSIPVLIAIFCALVALALFLRRQPATRDPSELSDEEPAEDDIGVIPIEDAIDLHGFQPREIPQVVESYLEAAVEKGYREVRLIHGRGKGVQRRRVQDLLARHPLVERYADAPAHRGGWGATIAWLKVDAPRS